MLCINIEKIETIAVLQYYENARKMQCLTVYLCHPKDCHQKKKKPHTGLEENFTKQLNIGEMYVVGRSKEGYALHDYFLDQDLGKFG